MEEQNQFEQQQDLIQKQKRSNEQFIQQTKVIENQRKQIEQIPNKIQDEVNKTIDKYDADKDILQLQLMLSERKLDEQKMKYDQEIKELQNTLNQNENTIQRLNEQINQMDDQLLENKKEIKKQQNEIVRLQGVIEDNKEIYEEQKALLKGDIEKIKENNDVFIEIIDKQKNDMSSQYISKIRVQSQDYNNLLYEQQQQNKLQSEQIERIQKEKLLLEDQIIKQNVYYKDWTNQFNKLKQQNQQLEQKMSQLQKQISQEKKFRRLVTQESRTEKQIEELISERTNLEIELKNTLEQQQSQYTIEKYKLTEQIKSFQRKLEETKFQLLKDKELLEDKILQLNEDNHKLTIKYQKTKQKLDEIEYTHSNQLEIQSKEWQRQLNQMEKQHKLEIIKRKLIAYLQQEVLNRKYQNQIHEQSRKINQNKSNLFQLYDNKKQISVQSLINTIDNLNEEQQEVIREKFKKDLWVYVKNKSVQREQKFETQIQLLKMNTSKHKNELDKTKQTNNELQQTIETLNQDIQILKQDLNNKIRSHEKQIKEMTQSKADDIAQLKSWLSDTTQSKDKEIQKLIYINQQQSHQLQLLSKKNKQVNSTQFTIIQLVDELNQFQTKLQESLILSKQKALQEANQMFSNQQEYMEQLLDKIKYLQQFATNSFSWQGEERVQRHIDDIFNTQIGNQFKHRSKTISRKTNSHRTEPMSPINYRTVSTDSNDKVISFLEGRDILDLYETKQKNKNFQNNKDIQDIEQERRTQQQMKNTMKLTFNRNYKIFLPTNSIKKKKY